MTSEFGVNPTGFLLQNSFLVGVLVRAKGGVKHWLCGRQAL